MNSIPGKKFILLIIIISSLSAHVLAQSGRIIRNQGLYYTIEPTIGYGLKLETDYLINVDEYSPYNMGIKATVNYFLNYNLSIGAGTGFMRYENPGMTTLPVLANAKWFITRIANSPFVYADAGFSYRFSNHRQFKGTPYEVGIGYRLSASKRRNNFWIFKVGYSGFKTNNWRWELTPDGRENGTNEFQWYNLKRQTINLTIGFYRASR